MGRIPRRLALEGTADELAVQKAGFDALFDGRAPTPEELGSAAGLDAQRTGVALEAMLEKESLMVTDDGRIDGIAGVTARPTRHQLTVEGRTVHTWCAFDSVGIPAALEATATARTTCGECGREIEVHVTDGAIEPGGLWGFLPTLSDDGGFRLISTFCSRANLFCDGDHLERWYEAAGRPDGEAYTIDELADIGRATWVHCRRSP